MSDSIKVSSVGGGAASSTTDTLSGQFTGAVTPSQSRDLRFEKIGNIVTLTMDGTGFEVTAAASLLNYSLSVSAGFRPIRTCQWPIVVTNNGSRAIGVLEIQDNGTITIGKDAGRSAFDGTVTNGIRGFSVSYVVA